MVDMTSTYIAMVASIDEDIERLTVVLATVTDIRVNKRRDDDSNLEGAIRGIGGEIAWLQSKRSEANKYLVDDNGKPINVYGDNGEMFPKLGDE